MFEGVGKDKRTIFIIILLAVMIIAIIIAIRFFAASVKDNEGGNGEASQTINIKTQLKKLDTKILNSPKFNKLKEYKVGHTAIKDLNIGKDNPFEAN